MQILSQPDKYIIVQALGMLADALDADLEEGNVADADKIYVEKMIEDTQRILNGFKAEFDS